MAPDTPIEHISGMLVFKAQANLMGGVIVEIPEWMEPEEIGLESFGMAVAEFIAWHRGNIWNQLNGFSGYDRIQFKFVQVADD